MIESHPPPPKTVGGGSKERSHRLHVVWARCVLRRRGFIQYWYNFTITRCPWTCNLRIRSRTSLCFLILSRPCSLWEGEGLALARNARSVPWCSSPLLAAAKGRRGRGIFLPMRKNQDLAKTLRKDQTDVEGFLWQFLRAKRLQGYKFRRQHPIGGYILDFYCPEKKLAIEVDGGQHSEDNQMVYDQNRTAILEKDGIRVLRFWIRM